MRYAIVHTGKKFIAFLYDWQTVVDFASQGMRYITSVVAKDEMDALETYACRVIERKIEREKIEQPEHNFQGVQTFEDLGKLWHQVILRTLKEEGYNQTNAAKRLGVTTRKVNYYCEQHGITTPQWEAMKMRFAR